MNIIMYSRSQLLGGGGPFVFALVLLDFVLRALRRSGHVSDTHNYASDSEKANKFFYVFKILEKGERGEGDRA